MSVIYGSTNFKNILIKIHKYQQIKNFLQSQKQKYVNEFIKIEKINKSDLIELHNRPIYLSYLENKLKKITYILYFHNDPLSMNGSKSLSERLNLIKKFF